MSKTMKPATPHERIDRLERALNGEAQVRKTHGEILAKDIRFALDSVEELKARIDRGDPFVPKPNAEAVYQRIDALEKANRTLAARVTLLEGLQGYERVAATLPSFADIRALKPETEAGFLKRMDESFDEARRNLKVATDRAAKVPLPPGYSIHAEAPGRYYVKVWGKVELSTFSEQSARDWIWENEQKPIDKRVGNTSIGIRLARMRDAWRELDKLIEQQLTSGGK